MTSSLTPLRQAPLSNPSQTRHQIVSKTSPPPVVQSGIRNVLIAFPAGSPSHPDDRMQLMRIYAGACEGFEVGVVDYVLQSLVYNNPRNPFPPSAQDVRELCKKTSRVVTAAAARYRIRITYRLFFLDDGSPCPPSPRPPQPSDYWKSEWGPYPDEEHCLVSDATILSEVRNQIKHEEVAILALTEDEFRAIPDEVFPDGFREAMVKKRAQKNYEASLSVEEQRARQFVIWSMRSSDDPSEEEIRRRTAERLRIVRTQRGSGYDAI